MHRELERLLDTAGPDIEKVSLGLFLPCSNNHSILCGDIRLDLMCPSNGHSKFYSHFSSPLTLIDRAFALYLLSLSFYRAAWNTSAD